MSTPFEMLVAMFAADLNQAQRMAQAHRLDVDGRCCTCHAGGAGSGRPFGCTVGAGALAALRNAASRAAKGAR